LANHVKEFTKMEEYLCNRFGIDLHALDQKIMCWAQEDQKRWKEWEELVRCGERLKELQMFAKSLSTEKPVEEETVSGGISDL